MAAAKLNLKSAKMKSLLNISKSRVLILGLLLNELEYSMKTWLQQSK